VITPGSASIATPSVANVVNAFDFLAAVPEGFKTF
jgi:hypothetical protein